MDEAVREISAVFRYMFQVLMIEELPAVLLEFELKLEYILLLTGVFFKKSAVVHKGIYSEQSYGLKIHTLLEVRKGSFWLHSTKPLFSMN